METTNKVVEVIEVLCEKFGIVVDWTSSNILPYIEELLGRFINFKIGTSIFWICFIPMLTLIAFFVAKPFHKKALEDEYDYDYDSPWIATGFWVIFAGLAIASIFVVGCNIYSIIECLTIPEKVIIDYLTSNPAQ